MEFTRLFLYRPLVPTQAITHASNQSEALCRYRETGRLTIDDNASEHRLRDQAIGRKNWELLGSGEADFRAAVRCTTIAEVKRHRLQARAYVHDALLQRSVNASPDFLAKLSADSWVLAYPEHAPDYRLEESRQKARGRDPRRASRTQSK